MSSKESGSREGPGGDTVPEDMAGSAAHRPAAAPAGRRWGRGLLASELGVLFRRRRTWAMLCALAAIPILIAVAFSTAAVGAALWLPWLIFAGIVFVLAAVCGLVFEYYVGPEKH